MDTIHQILKAVWNYDEFRPLQEDIIKSVLEGNDTLGLMPTGGGKSLTFQVPALAMKGICIVVTPLISLMKDQVLTLKGKGILATAIYSGMSHKDIVRELDNCILGDYKFLYVSPERLSTDLFLTKAKQLKVSMIAVDESHCISQWGYDFRPSYLKIADIRELLPDPPVLALTATATPDVVEDIQQQLHFNPSKQVFKKSFMRENLAYVVRYSDDKEQMMLNILEKVPGSSVVYVRNRKKTKEIAEFLNQNGIIADYYHAGISDEDKDERQIAWKMGKCRVIVATNAFGMGIDKPDVRTVIHLDMPDSLEAYFQEAGRAGRDGEKAYAVLIYSNADTTKLKKRIPDTYPDKEFIANVYNSMCNYFQIAEGEGEGYTGVFEIGKFCTIYKYNINQTHSALQLIQQAGYITLDEDPEARSRVIFSVTRDELYDIKTTEQEDMVMHALMRNYSGLFSDYVYIDENLIAKATGMTRDRVYEILSELRRNGALNYIPLKKEPRITLTRGRVDKKYFSLGNNVYEKRREQYIKRISSAINYATDRTLCRSKMLLSYFGEYDSKDCGCCDNCLAKKKRPVTEDLFEQIHQMIKTLLSSIKSSPTPKELLFTLQGYDQTKLKEVLRWMLDNGEIKINKENKVELTNK